MRSDPQAYLPFRQPAYPKEHLYHQEYATNGIERALAHIRQTKEETETPRHKKVNSRSCSALPQLIGWPVAIGSGEEISFVQAAENYLQEHYNKAWEHHVSLPVDYHVPNDKFEYYAKWTEETHKKSDGTDVELRPGLLADANVFYHLKRICGDAPSLLISTDVLNEAFSSRNPFISRLRQACPPTNEEVLKILDGHFEGVTFLAYPSEDKVYCIFFKTNEISSLVTDHGSTENGKRTFGQTQEDLQKFLQKNNVDTPLATKIKSNGTAMSMFKSILSKYLCASRSIDVPRTFAEYIRKVYEQMERVLGFLTPHQQKLVHDVESPWLLVTGAPGTGKTIVVTEKAKKLAQQDATEIVVVNLAGGYLTKNFIKAFEGINNIIVVDGKEKEIEENREGIASFLEKEGMGRHVLFDEVPLTLGFQGRLNEESLSERWNFIYEFHGKVKSLTFVFRPNDPDYKRDIDLQKINIKDGRGSSIGIEVLNAVKRNTLEVSKLFLALSNYSRRIFVSQEPTIRHMEFQRPEETLMPDVFAIPSCFALHDACKNSQICEAVRSSQALRSHTVAVVDTIERRDCLLKTLRVLSRHQENKTQVGFVDAFGLFRGDPNSSVLVVTADQILGCHFQDDVVILDLWGSIWRNYPRMISSHRKNITIATEQETLDTGKYSQLKLPPRYSQHNYSQIKDKLDIVLKEEEEMKKELNEPFEPEITFTLRSKKLKSLNIPQFKGRIPSKVTVIFGPPCSGKTTKLLDMITDCVKTLRSQKRREGFLLLHMGSILSQKDLPVQLGDYFDMLDIERSDILTPINIINHEGVDKVRWKFQCSTIHVYVDDYCIQATDTDEEKRNWEQALQKLKTLNSGKQILILNVVFQPHSKSGKKISVRELMKFFDKPEMEVVKTWEGNIPKQSTDPKLLKSFYENETCKSFQLGANSLPTGSRPAAIVPGSTPKHIHVEYECKGKHLCYNCKGQENCMPYLGAFICFRYAERAVPEGELVYVLVSDNNMKSFLESWKGDPNYSSRSKDHHKMYFVHPMDFRGCESRFTITVNVEASWLLESLSRAQTNLHVIDCLPDHQEVWLTMWEEGKVHREIIMNEDVDRDILLTLNAKGKFLDLVDFENVPTWNDTARSVGEVAMRKAKKKRKELGILDFRSDGVLLLPPETLDVLNRLIPDGISSSSSPFHDWGYVHKRGSPGAVPEAPEKQKDEILSELKRKGLEWDKDPPIPLETGGVLESLSVSLTGSLLHLPHLQRRLVEEISDPLGPFLHSVAFLLQRTIVLIQKNKINSRQMWMPVDKLPQVYGPYKIPSTLKKLSFKGKMDVEWMSHTVPLLWAMEWNQKEIGPLSYGEVGRVRDGAEKAWEGGYHRPLREGMRPSCCKIIFSTVSHSTDTGGRKGGCGRGGDNGNCNSSRRGGGGGGCGLVCRSDSGRREWACRRRGSGLRSGRPTRGEREAERERAM
ncbi:unnamed protein product [Darwinula stevensoni]|uniref:Uncharacterized protein n=1 Tax=Darwinula stevensoni TaxID=69355 RepID=A0A7R8X368_9CRUS|nr:unnamed protein product [Darwinula stevensoni]CAG0882040.1 unnamed protein product [Darwinula stevensoni]